MAKKNNNNGNEAAMNNATGEALGGAELSNNNNKPVPKKNSNNNAKGNKNNNKKPNVFVRMGRSFKEMFSELKKITWADGKNVLSSTLVVIGVVFIFFICLLGIDSGLAALLELLIPKA